MARAAIAILAVLCVGLAALAFLWRSQLETANHDLAGARATIATQSRQLSSSPKFTLISSGWAGPCDSVTGCPAQGSFRNLGGPGSGIAIFKVRGTDGTSYGQCTATIPQTGMYGAGSASCTIVSGQLHDFIRSHPGNLPLVLDAGTT